MKFYSISKWAFRGICLLILLLPVSRHWRLLSSGERTKGTVTGYVERSDEHADERYPVLASEIEFKVGGKTFRSYGPANFEYSEGRQLSIFYDRKEPSMNCVASFTGFYLSYYTVVPIILLTVWYAFYLSFNKYRRKKKMPKGKISETKRRPGRPPSHPLLRIPCL